MSVCVPENIARSRLWSWFTLCGDERYLFASNLLQKYTSYVFSWHLLVLTDAPLRRTMWYICIENVTRYLVV